MKKNGESEDGMGRARKRRKNLRRRAVETVEFSVPAGLMAGRSVRGPVRAPRRGGEIQAAVGGVGDLLVHAVHGRGGIQRRS